MVTATVSGRSLTVAARNEMNNLRLTALETLPEFRPGDDLGLATLEAAAREGFIWTSNCVLVVAQKAVSKCEGAIVDLREVTPSTEAQGIATELDKDPRLVEVILRQSRRIIRKESGVLITETHHGWICANSGVDRSNVPGADHVALLPKDPDASARKIRESIRRMAGVDCAVVISDTFGRPWRMGLVNVAIGVAGFAPLVDLRGERDAQGLPLEATQVALADELAAAAGLTMPKTGNTPVVVVEGLRIQAAAARAKQLQRPAEQDLFR